jgi:hypothetical protein
MADPLPKEDLDAFLTSVEAKLRGPFSSLDLTRAAQTAALRTTNDNNNTNNNNTKNTNTTTQYLQRLATVLHKADKIVQMRVLIGLLGLLPAVEDNDAHQQVGVVVWQILTAAGTAPVHEEWVRVVAGLVQGILFRTSSDSNDNEDEVGNNNDDNNNNTIDNTMDNNNHTRARGPEAAARLEKTCATIIQRVRALERDTAATTADPPCTLVTADVDPTACPYRYALLNPALLQQVLPETLEHAHFGVVTIKNSTTNSSATAHACDILWVDQKEESAKQQEEQEHGTSLLSSQRAASASTASSSSATNTASSTAKTAASVDFPGFRSKSKAAAATSRSKSSMFMPKARKPATAGTAAAGGGGMRQTTGTTAARALPANKTVLHQRKAGAAQALLAKGRRRLAQKGLVASHAGSSSSSGTGATGSGSGTTLGTTGTTATTTTKGGRSKMKMIDAAEVQGLAAKEQQQQQQQQNEKKKGKRKSEAAGAVTEKVSRLKQDPVTTKAATATAADENKVKPKATAAAASTDDSAGALASAALSKYQAQLAGVQATVPASAAAAPTPAAAAAVPKQQDWRHLLKEKSNKLSGDDRFRVQQFFVDRFNPTPAQPTFKMKLHEERTVDPKTAEPVKETYYLELDYRTFTSKQSKKVKRYRDA